MRSAAANFHLTWVKLPVVKEMGGLGDVSFGFGLAVRLQTYVKPDFLGPGCEVHFNVKKHLLEPFAELNGLDTWGCVWLCAAKLQELCLHLQRLSEHKVFDCGRSFYFEGFEVVEKWSDNGRNLQRVDVSCRWGS